MSMRTATVLLGNTAAPLCNRAWLAQHPHHRLRGLLFRPPLQPGQGLFLAGISSVHTFAMRYPIDIVFLDGDLYTTGTRRSLQPSRIVFGPSSTCNVLELPSGAIERFGIEPGLRLRLHPEPAARTSPRWTKHLQRALGLLSGHAHSTAR